MVCYFLSKLFLLNYEFGHFTAPKAGAKHKMQINGQIVS